MEARTFQAFLRVLYTVNSNPQYILAKSSSQVSVISCSETTSQPATNEPTYARAPLKACLAAVSDSSPELLQNPARDFSLYFLDPLETQPLRTGLAHTPRNTNSPRGVAVALGLMSWALESNESANVFVTGTIIPNASLALEVVCALRETKRMPKPTLHSYPFSSPISVPGPPHPPGMSWSSTSHSQCDQQQQQTLTRSADFPELYIGPPRRARGRPEGSASSTSKVKVQASASSLPASSSEVAKTQSESKQVRRSRQKTKHRPPRDPPTYSPFICAPLTRHTATAAAQGNTTGIPTLNQQPRSSSQNQIQSHTELYPKAQLHFHPTHNPLLELLSAISSTYSGTAVANITPEQQATFLSTLQGLLATNSHMLQSVATNTGLSTRIAEKTTQERHESGNAGGRQDDGDSDIVILDSSTIDTTIFRKPSTRERPTSDHDTSSFTTNRESPLPTSQSTDSSLLPANTLISEQQNAPTSSQTSAASGQFESASLVMSDAETPTFTHVSSRWSEKRYGSTSHALDVPATPTPSRTRKRKLDEHGQVHSSVSMSLSPSPSVARNSSATVGTKSVSSTPVRLPSMLGSMRGISTSGISPQVCSSGPSTRGHLASSNTNKNGSQSPISLPRPSKSKADDIGITDASSNGIVSDATSLKRRRTLTEFMAEHEARKNAKIRKQSSSGRKLDISANAPQAASRRSANLGSTSRHARSSPSRPLFRSDPMVSVLVPPTSTYHNLVPGTAGFNPASELSTMTLPSTGPSTSNLTAVQTKNPLKNFVLPAWARTSTATLPRLSEEALVRQQAEREVKKAQIALRRREVAKAKRKRLRGASHPSKGSSNEDDETVVSDAIPRTLCPSFSSNARSTPLPQPPLTSLPVFASDAVEHIPSSPPQSDRSLALPVVPSTPPRKSVPSLGSGTHRTPSKSGSCSLFTPSGQEPVSLFTPSTPSVTRSRVTFTPRSPTVLHRSGGSKKSPWKSVLQTPCTPRRHGSDHPTTRSFYADKTQMFTSLSTATRTPQTHTGMGTRVFLLPPPSPCALRTPQRPNRAHSKVPGGSTPISLHDSGIPQQPALEKQNVEWNKEEDILSHELDEALLGKDATILPAQDSPSRQDCSKSESYDIALGGQANPAEEDYASSPLPPSSPLPASPFSSPKKHDDDGFDTQIIDNIALPDSDMLLSSASDSDEPRRAADPTWLSGSASTPAMWFTDSEANAWLTETEAWLTDAEGGGGPLLTDSDAVFADMSSLASNWLSDDADVDTDDGELGAMVGGQDGEFDTAASRSVYATLVEPGGRGSPLSGSNLSPGPATHAHDAHSTVVASDSQLFWETIQTFLGGSTATTPEDAQDIQALLDGLVGT